MHNYLLKKKYFRNKFNWLHSRKRSLSKFNKYNIRKRIQFIKMSNVSIVHVFNKKFEILCNILSKMFNKNVELDLIRLHYPYNNSNILVNLLAMLLKKLKFRRITRRLFRKMVIKSIKKYFINNKTTKIIPSVKDNVQYNNEGNSMNKYNIIKSALPAFLTGLHIKVGGRVINLSMKSRKTVNIVERGSSSIGKVNYTDYARFTNKNKRGAYSITVSSGQNIF